MIINPKLRALSSIRRDWPSLTASLTPSTISLLCSTNALSSNRRLLPPLPVPFASLSSRDISRFNRSSLSWVSFFDAASRSGVAEIYSANLSFKPSPVDDQSSQSSKIWNRRFLHKGEERCERRDGTHFLASLMVLILLPFKSLQLSLLLALLLLILPPCALNCAANPPLPPTNLTANLSHIVSPWLGEAEEEWRSDKTNELAMDLPDNNDRDCNSGGHNGERM